MFSEQAKSFVVLHHATLKDDKWQSETIRENGLLCGKQTQRHFCSVFDCS